MISQGTVLVLGIQLSHIWHGHYGYEKYTLHDHNADSKCLLRRLPKLVQAIPIQDDTWLGNSVIPLLRQAYLGWKNNGQKFWDTGQVDEDIARNLPLLVSVEHFHSCLKSQSGIRSTGVFGTLGV